jgi:hypothetical protein
MASGLRSPLISARIQHHPSRVHLLPDLQERLWPLDTEVIEHSSSPPNPWHGYRKCLIDIPACDHLLVIQDDAMPCLNFVPALKQVARTCGDIPVCLFLSAHPSGTAGRARQAMLRDHRYIYFGYAPYVYAVAILWPRRKAIDFLNWTDSGARLTSSNREARADDGVIARWAKDQHQEFRVTVPSLVEHPDVVDPVKGAGHARYGKDRARVALFLADDGLAYRW